MSKYRLGDKVLVFGPYYPYKAIISDMVFKPGVIWPYQVELINPIDTHRSYDWVKETEIIPISSMSEILYE